MRISGIIWLDNVVEKIEVKHHVIIEEVEEVFRRKPKVRKMRKGRFLGESVYRSLGQTKTGRYLTIFFIFKRTGEALILSARDMDKKERNGYAKK